MSKGKTKELSKSVRTESRRETYNECNTCPSITVFAMEHPSALEFSTFKELNFWNKGSIHTLCLVQKRFIQK